MCNMFSWKYYLNKYEDLRKAGIKTEAQASCHWLRFGKKEKRVGCNDCIPCRRLLDSEIAEMILEPDAVPLSVE